MFDLEFYNCVLGITKYYRFLFENPAKVVPRNGSEKTIRDHLLDIEGELGKAFRCCFFNYYIKMYLQYFNLKYLMTPNHGFFHQRRVALFPEECIEDFYNCFETTSYAYPYYYEAYCKMQAHALTEQIMFDFKNNNL